MMSGSKNGGRETWFYYDAELRHSKKLSIMIDIILNDDPMKEFFIFFSNGFIKIHT